MFEEDDSDRQVRYVNAYDPNPLPVKPPRDASVAGTPAYGEREQTEYVAPLITSRRSSARWTSSAGRRRRSTRLTQA